MVVNFRARGISRGARKLARTPTLNKKKISASKQSINAFYLHNILFSRSVIIKKL
jgi:hypothetical protein